MKAYLVLKDGTFFEGSSFGYEDENFEVAGEVVFNTSMSGYQEILTDPSYKWQIVCLTYPEIGNYGINAEDEESFQPHASGLIVKHYNSEPSNFRSEKSLSDYLKDYKIPAIQGIDTRALVRHIRTQGAMGGLLAIGDHDIAKLKRRAKELPTIEGMDLVKEVTCSEPYVWTDSVWQLEKSDKSSSRKRKKLKIIAYDFGMKKNILRNLVSIGCEVKVVPAQTLAREVLKEKPDGVFLSNGPGDPSVVTYAIENISNLIGKVPLFGICLGHQILSLALGAETFKLKFGHRGGNHPVIDLTTEKVEITSQNHGFAVEEKSLQKIAKLTHLNLNDRTVEGISDEKKSLFSVQYHPEASPGPHDSLYLFERFRKMMERAS